ncbi:glycerol-3-phosphate phosphatase-like [Temnothorax americanus]|uniref:glycerol-3-phosphate phosphatase-like n=1 Tax=Temnothorax americanus TaxID=1964332 RepID=UPI004067D665
MSAINVKALTNQNVWKFLKSFDTVLTDCDGVLWMNKAPLPHSADVVNLFHRLGKRVFYVTNNPTKTRDDLVEKFQALQFEATKDDILCTAHLSASYLQSLGFRKKVYVIGSEAIGKELEEVGISYCGIGLDPVNQNIPYSVFEKDPEVAAVIIGFDEHFNYPKMVKAATYLSDANVHFIGTNTDQRDPASNDVVIPATGCLVKCIENCSGRKAMIVGKPDKYMAKMLMEQSNVDPQRTLMIGDRGNTDMLFGNRCGFTTLLVLTGVTALSDVERWKQSERQEERKFVPNYYIDALGDLLPYLKKLKTEMSHVRKI